MQNAEKHPDESKPPFFKSWQNMYALVIGFLILQIVLYYSITHFFE